MNVPALSSIGIDRPGTKRRSYLEQNVAALELELSAENLARLDEAAPAGTTAGDRYGDMSRIGR